MMDSQDKTTIIRIIRKKGGGHDEHHGGSWKVAYADFVTAMMAFFLVMWVVGMDPEIKSVVEYYFHDPVGFKEMYGAGSNPLPIRRGSTMARLLTQNQGSDMIAAREVREQRALEDVGMAIKDKLSGGEEFALGGQVKVTMTAEGLRIELSEIQEEGTFFALGSAELKPGATHVLELIVPELMKVDNPIVIEGHTDSRPLTRAEYTNWELSNDRANAARRALTGSGLPADRVIEVRGYADRRPAVVDDPLHPSNRRISILVPFLDGLPVAAKTPPQGEAGRAGESGSLPHD